MGSEEKNVRQRNHLHFSVLDLLVRWVKEERRNEKKKKPKGRLSKKEKMEKWSWLGVIFYF